MEPYIKKKKLYLYFFARKFIIKKMWPNSIFRTISLMEGDPEASLLLCSCFLLHLTQGRVKYFSPEINVQSFFHQMVLIFNLVIKDLNYFYIIVNNYIILESPGYLKQNLSKEHFWYKILNHGTVLKI